MTNQQQAIMEILSNPRLTHEQQVFQLASAADGSMPPVESSATRHFQDLLQNGLVCDMGEGNAPYAPRYILPDYQKFMEQGSEFLRLPPPKTLYEAIYSLLIFYRSVPSVTHFPVYLGNLGALLEPFCEGLSDDAVRQLLKGFLIQLDRTFGDSFVHANIGPERTRAGEILLDLTAELQNAIPNMTLIYDPEITPDDFACMAIRTALVSANPAFALDSAYKADFHGHPYGIASCYNGLPVCGGAFTLQRLKLKEMAEAAASKEDFFDRVLPDTVQTMCTFMEGRIRFLVEDTAFFQSSFLVKEKFIDLDNFVGLLGLVGLAECVDHLMDLDGNPARYGPDAEANELGLRIMDAIQAMLKDFTSAYSPIADHHFMLHAQVGLGGDASSPGVRIPIGREIPLYDHLRQAGLFHKYFPTGVGDIFPFETTAKQNPEAILDVFKGAFSVGMRYISTYAEDSDLIRVTGYLVKKSEVQAVAEGKQSAINDMSLIAGRTLETLHILERKVRGIDDCAGQSNY